MLLDEPIESTKKLEDINVKIADFGLSRVNDTDMMTGILGTFVYFLILYIKHWMAPEIFESKPYSNKADIYSFGVVIWEICCRETPYKNLANPHAIMKYVTVDKGRPCLTKI